MQKNNKITPGRTTEKSMLLLFSHRLTPEQQQHAKMNYGVTSFRSPPKEIQTIWSQIPPDADYIDPVLSPVKIWLEQHAEKGDVALIQGDFGATVLMVNHAISLGVIPVYATTQRQAREKELPDGGIETYHIFTFKQFRIYGQ
jgi:hypothetical protein